MPSILKQIETPYVDAQTLLPFLCGYQRPRDAILRMVKNGELIRLSNGFYLVAEKIEQKSGRVIPYEQVANRLYGPSYVSLEWALSFYGMIPERVHTVTSMTNGRDKTFHTPIGDFVYHRLNDVKYSVGVTQKAEANFLGNFFIASPEKALADLVFVTCRYLDKEELKIELLESKRIDPEALLQMDKELLSQIATAYRAKSVDHLLNIVGIL